MRTGWVSLAIVVGCGGGGGGHGPITVLPDTAVSGTRLKLAWYDFGGGVKTWASATDLYDAQLATPCTPMPWGDGVTRCTPPLAPVAFADAQCTQPVLLGDEQFGAGIGTGCNTQTALGPLYESTGNTISVTQLWIRDGNTCSEADPPNPLVAVSAAAHPTSDLVTITTQEQGDGRLQIDTLVGDDGLVVPLQPHDAMLGVSCDVSDIVGGASLPCKALGAPNADDLYSDAQCKAAATWVPASGCPAPALAYIDTNTCPEYHAIGDPVGPTAYMGPFGCVQQGVPSDGSTLHALGPIVDALQLARAPATSSGRVQLEYLTDAVGATRFRDPRELWDAQLMTECRMSVVADGGTSECRPDGHVYGRGQLYSDAACTQPISGFLIEYGDDTCESRTPPPYLTIDFLSPTTDIYKVGAVHPGPIYQGVDPTDCIPISWPMYDLAGPVDESTLPRATKVRDQ
jgi:hypothetical protein